MLQTKSQTQYTIKELQSYVKNPNSSVHRITDKLHIGLAPAGLANFKDAVVSSVTRAKVGRFDQKLNGIVLDIRNFKVLGNVFAIHDDDPQLHVDLYADLYVFQPTVGAVIKGVVKHIARGHISVTVHRVFNVAIRLDGDKEGLEVNMEIVIRITDFDLTLKLPFIAGVLDQPLSVATKKIVFDANSDESDSDEVDRKALVSQFLADNNVSVIASGALLQLYFIVFTYRSRSRRSLCRTPTARAATRATPMALSRRVTIVAPNGV